MSIQNKLIKSKKYQGVYTKQLPNNDTVIYIAYKNKIKNHLEHFDERLDNYVKNYKGQPHFDCNLITGAKGFPINDCLRALDGDNYIFYGEKFNIEEVYIELCNILET